MKQASAFILLSSSLVLGLYFYTQFQTQKQSQKISVCDNITDILSPLSFSVLKEKKPKKFKEFQGKSTYLINFWGVDCAPCVREWPSLIKFVKKTKIPLLTFTSNSGEEIEDFFKTLRIFPHWKNIYIGLDSKGEIRKSLKVQSIPQTFLISEKGEVLRVFIGFKDWMSSEVLSYFKNLKKIEKCV